MMTRQKLYILFLFLTLSCVSSFGQSNVRIEGYGSEILDGDSIYLSYKINGRHILRQTIARDHQFSFRDTIDIPVKANISRNENPSEAAVITESVRVYLEPGKITINSPNTLTGATISGTPLNDTLQLLQERLMPVYTKMRAIKDPDFFTDTEKEDTLLVKRNYKALERAFYEAADIKLTFADNYPHSFVSLDLLEELSAINTYIFQTEKVYNKLPSSSKQSRKGKLIHERIMKKKQVVPGMTAPDFSMKDTNSRTIDLSSFKGTYVLLDFWASWCLPCRAEHPNLLIMNERYKNKGFSILSISIDTHKQAWLDAIKTDGIDWTQVSDLKGNKGDLYLQYGITSIPANFLIDPNGVVIAKDLTGDALKEKLSQIFDQ